MKNVRKANKAVKKTSANKSNEFVLDSFNSLAQLNAELDSIHNFIEQEYKKLNKLYTGKFIPFTNALITDIQSNTNYYINDVQKIENLMRAWYLVWLRYTTNVDFLLDGFTEGCHRDYYRYKADVSKCTSISFTAGERNYASTMELSASSVYFISNSYNQKETYVPHLYSREHKEKNMTNQKSLHQNNELKASLLSERLDNLRLCLLQQEPLKSLKHCLLKSLNIRFDNDFGDRKRNIDLYGFLNLNLAPSTALYQQAIKISEGVDIQIQLHRKVESYLEKCERKKRLFKGFLNLISLYCLYDGNY